MIDDEITKFSVQVIGAATGLGAPDKRCQGGPEEVWQHAKLAGEGLEWRRILTPQENDSGNSLLALSAFSILLANEVAAALQCQDRVAVIGGDHSCAIGSWAGVAKAFTRKGDIGLIWIDAHMDAHTPETSPSLHWHGMPVACLLGQGEQSLINIAGDKPIIKPENLCLIGIRSYEAPELELLQRLGVKVFTMDDVNRLGFEQVMQMAQGIVTEKTVAYGISIDLDGLDPADAPAVGSPVVGGIGADDLLKTLSLIQNDSRMAVLEIAEFNPVVDQDQRTLKLIMKILSAITEARKSNESND